MMNNFVISLKSTQDRRNHILEQFGKEGIPFQFFDAITPDLNQVISKELKINILQADLTQGEIACFLSHASIWKMMIEKKLSYVVIFEDDIYLGKEVLDFLSSIDVLDLNFDIIKLESFFNRIEVDPNFKLKLANRNIYKLQSMNLGAAGYIISLEAAKKIFLDLNVLDKIVAVDHYLFENLLNFNFFNIYMVEPSICKQDFLLNNANQNFKSSLEKARANRLGFNPNKIETIKKKICFYEKIWRELSRPFRKLKNSRSKNILFSNFK
ncbi:hypothetical protein CU320_06000 [Acinetobacter pseudolwoffii]|uniref:Glycosyl transferase family 25 domain-containing protein n=2 Tax=Moraxellaceae TaxID=468 RepID=A0A2H9UML4_9GAMM|nr:hypothetical protein CU320_06000 [Acinetobacter pseudolwoffii]